MIAAGMCGYLYDTITFFVVLLTEIYRILSANDAPNIMMIFSLYIYVVIGMLTGFAVKKLWFRSWKRCVRSSARMMTGRYLNKKSGSWS